MATIEIGCGQITWSNDTPEDQVLAEIAQAGYAGAPAGPSKGRTAAQVQAVFAHHGLKPAPGYLGVDFWRADQHDSIIERAREYAAFMRELGCSELYVAAGGFTVERLCVREIPRSGTPEELIDHYGISSRHIVAAVTA